MKIKLTTAQFKALYAMFQIHVVAVRPSSIETIMLHGLLMSIYKKLYNRAYDVRKKYTLPLTDSEACAFYFFFSRLNLQSLPFENNLIQTINNNIHQLYA